MDGRGTEIEQLARLGLTCTVNWVLIALIREEKTKKGGEMASEIDVVMGIGLPD